jgi:hypothetical protein
MHDNIIGCLFIIYILFVISPFLTIVTPKTAENNLENVAKTFDQVFCYKYENGKCSEYILESVRFISWILRLYPNRND